MHEVTQDITKIMLLEHSYGSQNTFSLQSLIDSLIIARDSGATKYKFKKEWDDQVEGMRNYSIEVYRVKSEEEIREDRIKKLKKELKELEETKPNN